MADFRPENDLWMSQNGREFRVFCHFSENVQGKRVDVNVCYRLPCVPIAGAQFWNRDLSCRDYSLNTLTQIANWVVSQSSGRKSEIPRGGVLYRPLFKCGYVLLPGRSLGGQAPHFITSFASERPKTQNLGPKIPTFSKKIVQNFRIFPKFGPKNDHFGEFRKHEITKKLIFFEIFTPDFVDAISQYLNIANLGPLMALLGPFFSRKSRF